MRTSNTSKPSWQTTHKLAAAVGAFCAAAIIPGAAVLFSAAPPQPSGSGGGNPNQPSPVQRNDQGQNNANANPNRANRPANAIESGKLEFQTWTKIKGENIYTKDDKDLGNINNALISRGTGRIDYLVVTTGATLGIGGKEVLVPYDQLSFKTGERHQFRHDATPDQMKGMTEFSEKSWKDLRAPGANGNDPLNQALSRQPAHDRQDPYASNLNTGERASTIEGKITDVSRRNLNGMEQLVITVQDNAGKKQEVNLGPAGFVMGGDASPQRGQQVTVHTLRTRDGEAMLVATRVNYAGKDVRYREETGKAVWLNEGGRSIVPSRYILASELVGKDVDTKDGRLGTVEHLIVECNSGEVAFISIDPDRNFLGIGDTKRLVPFEIVTFQPNGHAGLDATKEMVLASRQTPKNLEDLRSDELRTQVFKSFDIQPQTFIARERSEWK